MAPLSVFDAIDEAFARCGTREGALALAAILTTQVLLLVGIQSQLSTQREQFGDDELPLIDPSLWPETFPLALEVPLWLSTLLWLSMLVGFVAATVGAFRMLVDTVPEATASAASGTATAPRPSWTHRLGRTTLLAVVASVVGLVMVGVGLVLFVIPGLVVATAFAFTHPYLVTTEAGVRESMQRSVALVRGAWLRVFALLVVIVLSFVTISSIGTFVYAGLESMPALAELLNLVFGALAWLYALALLASGFDQLEAQRVAESAKWADIDDELLP